VSLVVPLRFTNYLVLPLECPHALSFAIQTRVHLFLTVYDMWAPGSHVGPLLSPLPTPRSNSTSNRAPPDQEDANTSASHTAATSTSRACRLSLWPTPGRRAGRVQPGRACLDRRPHPPPSPALVRPERHGGVWCPRSTCRPTAMAIDRHPTNPGGHTSPNHRHPSLTHGHPSSPPL
jgi:hypothetical protein